MSADKLDVLLAEAISAAMDPKRVAERQAREAEEMAKIERVKALTWRSALEKATPARVRRFAWEPRETEAVQAVTQWLDGGCKKHLVLLGGVGCGKSTAACVAVKRWVEPEIRETNYGLDVFPNDCVTWMRADDVVSAVLHDYDENSPKIRRYNVIDDMGLETKAHFEAAMCELLDTDDITLLITANLTRLQMRGDAETPGRYGLRLLDRLNDTAIAIRLKGQSMRRQDGGF